MGLDKEAELFRETEEKLSGRGRIARKCRQNEKSNLTKYQFGIGANYGSAACLPPHPTPAPAPRAAIRGLSTEHRRKCALLPSSLRTVS